MLPAHRLSGIYGPDHKNGLKWHPCHPKRFALIKTGTPPMKMNKLTAAILIAMLVGILTGQG
ncbi:MAG: hypothetical protein WC013_03175, partial [Aeromonas bestiarum]